jgi:hypothetical protein
MRTGRLSISRGYREAVADKDPPHLALVPPAGAEPAESVPQALPASPDTRSVDARLSALERLVRLYEIGALTLEEFAAEKALILGEPPRAAPVHFVPARPRAHNRGPSLLGRMLSWQFLLLSLVAGLGFSFAMQPAATSRFATQLWHAIAG